MLLIRELLKQTRKHDEIPRKTNNNSFSFNPHPDILELEEAKVEIDRILHLINEEKRAAEVRLMKKNISRKTLRNILDEFS